MTAWRVAGFGGMVPALDDRLLPDTSAVLAENCILKSGTITPLPAAVPLKSVGVNTRYAYRLPASYADASFLFDSTWMEFDDPDTAVIRAPVIGDTYDRYYFVSPEQPPKYNTRARIDLGQPAWLLGIPAPTVAPGVVGTGGVDPVLEMRSYVYTYVSEYKEEGPPSPATTIIDNIDASYEITCTAALADDMGVNRNLKFIRIYRTVTNSDGTDAGFHLVVELPMPFPSPAIVVYTDTLTGDVVAAKPVLESTDYSGPPDDLYGWVLMPNGFIAAWRGNQYSEVWFSAPFLPHAWPAKYTLTVEYPVVGMGVTNQTLVVCTEAYPVTMQGINPEFIATNKLINHEPCSARGSILSGPEGVFYASPNGIILVQPGTALNITKDLISKKAWQTLLNVPRLRAARLGMAYFAYGTVGVGVFQNGAPDPAQVPDPIPDTVGPPDGYLPGGYNAFDPEVFETEDLTGSLVGVVIDPTSEYVSFSMLRSLYSVENCYNDPWSGEVILIGNNKINYIDIVTLGLQCSTAKWRSKIWQNEQLRNVSAAKVFFDTQFGQPEGVIRFFVEDETSDNGKLILERPLVKSGELIRLPSGYKAHFISFELEGKYRVKSVQFATAVKELVDA